LAAGQALSPASPLGRGRTSDPSVGFYKIPRSPSNGVSPLTLKIFFTRCRRLLFFSRRANPSTPVKSRCGSRRPSLGPASAKKEVEPPPLVPRALLVKRRILFFPWATQIVAKPTARSGGRKACDLPLVSGTLTAKSSAASRSAAACGRKATPPRNARAKWLGHSAIKHKGLTNFFFPVFSRVQRSAQASSEHSPHRNSLRRRIFCAPMGRPRHPASIKVPTRCGY